MEEIKHEPRTLRRILLTHSTPKYATFCSICGTSCRCSLVRYKLPRKGNPRPEKFAVISGTRRCNSRSPLPTFTAQGPLLHPPYLGQLDPNRPAGGNGKPAGYHGNEDFHIFSPFPLNLTTCPPRPERALREDDACTAHAVRN